MSLGINVLDKVSRVKENYILRYDCKNNLLFFITWLCITLLHFIV